MKYHSIVDLERLVKYKKNEKNEKKKRSIMQRPSLVLTME